MRIAGRTRTIRDAEAPRTEVKAVRNEEARNGEVRNGEREPRIGVTELPRVGEPRIGVTELPRAGEPRTGVPEVPRGEEPRTSEGPRMESRVSARGVGIRREERLFRAEAIRHAIGDCRHVANASRRRPAWASPCSVRETIRPTAACWKSSATSNLHRFSNPDGPGESRRRLRKVTAADDSMIAEW